MPHRNTYAHRHQPMESEVPSFNARPKTAMQIQESSASSAEMPKSTRCETLSPNLEKIASEQTATKIHCTTPSRLWPVESMLPAAAYR
jgi:hypothetical protein